MDIEGWVRPVCPRGHGDSLYIHKAWRKADDPTAFAQAIAHLMWMVNTADWWDGVVCVWCCYKCGCFTFHTWRFSDETHVVGYQSIVRGLSE